MKKRNFSNKELLFYAHRKNIRCRQFLAELIYAIRNGEKDNFRILDCKNKTMSTLHYIDINRNSWNNRLEAHLKSEFYDVAGFKQGNTSLKSFELDLLGDVKGLKILHLQCHFGQDSLSLARMGAEVTGIDLSDQAIHAAQELNSELGLNTRFICCDLYDLPNHLDESFDIVFTSYGTIGWLPDLEKWAGIISHFLKPGGQFVFVEFHPVVWMFDDAFEQVAYTYLNSGEIIEAETGTYADKHAAIHQEYVCWNHGIAEVLNNLITYGISIKSFQEFDYSPYNCFQNTLEFEPGKFRIAKMGNKIPMLYSLLGIKEINKKP